MSRYCCGTPTGPRGPRLASPQVWSPILVGVLVITGLSCSGVGDEVLPSIVPWGSGAPTSPAQALGYAGVELAASEPDPDGVELLGVGFAADGSYVVVTFKAPPEAVQSWWEGSIYVVDEETGAIYSNIPVMPKIGPLFGKPQEEGQIGYVMLANRAFGLKSGSSVTAVLGSFKRVHVVVQ